MDQTGQSEDRLALPDDITHLNPLKAWLEAHYDCAGQLSHDSIKTMINQEMVHGDAPLGGAVEIGFLPPVGGG